jgi:hypothetical protein
MTEAHKAALLAGRSSENKTAIAISNKLRLYAVDERNWSLQKLSGTSEAGEPIWLSISYYNNLAELMKATARRILNGELQAKGEVRGLIELANKIQEAEQNVLNMLQGLIPEEISAEEEQRLMKNQIEVDASEDDANEIVAA